ncbi:MAG: NADH-quinone oxidoreductase subunit NuoH [Planctomycetaceae bacterium]
MTPVLAASSILELLQQDLSPNAAYLLAAVLHAALVLGFFGVAPLIYIWLERKVAGRIQDRLGPTRVGGKFGWLQTLADGIKLIQKEDLCPEAADRMLFRMSPYLVFVASFAAFLVLPWADGWIAQNLDIGLFFMLAIMSLEVMGVILAGYSSGSKWALFGGMREAAQVVSYEIPMAICALVPVTAAGTLSLMDLGRIQSGPFLNWMIFHDPFCFIAFFVYFVVATASVKRAPFDLAEAESELVAGFHTEYSGIRWSYFFMAEYASMFAVSGVATALFLGGWNTGLGLEETVLAGWREAGGPWYLLANLLGAKVFITKGCLLVFVQMWVRWTLPRLRIDQVMTTCLKYLLPISCALFLGVAIWPLAVFKLTGRSTLVNSLKVMGTDIGRPMSERSFVPGVPQARHAGPVEAQATPVAPAPQGTDRAGAELRVPAAPTLVPAAADKVSSS